MTLSAKQAPTNQTKTKGNVAMTMIVKFAGVAALAVSLLQTPAFAQDASIKIPEQKVDEALRAKLPEAIRTAGKMISVNNGSFPPYEMTTDDGGYEGIDVEIATKIAEKLGLTLVVDDMEFSSVITAVQSGKSDIAMAGMTVTDERKENVDFTDTYANAVQVIIVPDGSEIRKRESAG